MTLKDVTPKLAVKIEAVLNDVRGKGLDPKVYETLRTKAQQAEKVRKGFSKTMRSRHLAGSDGKSRAVDIADRVKGWNASKRFWLILGSAYMAHGVEWGGMFGLSRKQKMQLELVIGSLRADGWPMFDERYQVKMGWDAGHGQI